MHFAGVSGDFLHWSVGCVPAHLTQRKVWLQYFCVCPYLWHLLHCTISCLICGSSNFTMAFIRRLVLYISLLLGFCFRSIKNRDNGSFVTLCLMLLTLMTSWPSLDSSVFRSPMSAEWWMFRSITRKGLSSLSW